MTNIEKLALKEAADRAQAASNAYAACVISQEEFLAEISDYRTLTIGPERVLALLAERDADKKRIAEQQEHISSLDEGVNMLLAQYDQLASAIGWTTEKALAGEGNQEQYAEAIVKRIAELEARTVSVKLPVVPSQYETLKLCLEPSDGYGMQKGAEYMRDEFIKALAAAGIKLEVGE